jgi:predicted TIM-barrel fold metal-dependent hydrolase
MERNGGLLLLTLVLAACTSDYYTIDDYYNVPKVDTHVHLEAMDSTLALLAAEDNFRLLTVNVDAPGDVALPAQYEFALHQARQHPDRINFLTSFTLHGWHAPGWADHVIDSLEQAFHDGALGVKLWKNIGMTCKDSSGNFIMADDPKFDPVIAFIIQQDKTVLAHIGEPKNCWLALDEMTVNNDRNYFKNHPEYHMHLHPEYPAYETLINARDRLLERHPDMRFVGAHLGSLEWSVDELAKRLDKFPNMAVDMAARIPHLQHQSRIDREKVRMFLVRYQDRIIYATDSGISATSDRENVKKYIHETWMNDWKYFVTDEMMTSTSVNGEFQGLKLPREVIDKIYRKNAVRWFRMQ